jgi:hypothetical protein
VKDAKEGLCEERATCRTACGNKVWGGEGNDYMKGKEGLHEGRREGRTTRKKEGLKEGRRKENLGLEIARHVFDITVLERERHTTVSSRPTARLVYLLKNSPPKGDPYGYFRWWKKSILPPASKFC